MRGESRMPQEALLHNLLLFNRLLRALGLDVGPGKIMEVQAALPHVPVTSESDFRYALRTILVKRKQDIPLFDIAFEVFWKGAAFDQALLETHSPTNMKQLTSAPRDHRLSIYEGQTPGAEGGELEDRRWPCGESWTAREALRQRDFAQLTDGEISAVRRMMGEIVWDLGSRRTRRHTNGSAGQLDVRSSLRRSLPYGTELLKWSFRVPKSKQRLLVILADVSGSMDRYARLLLQFFYGLKHGLPQNVEVFVFSTRLTRVTKQLVHSDVDWALREVTDSVQDWSGGTRIGDAVRTFNQLWARRMRSGGAVVLLVSDGWDRGDPAVLDREMARLNRLCHRLIWLNPLLGREGYKPLTRGMQVALPHIDDFLPVHNLASLEDLAGHLHNLD